MEEIKFGLILEDPFYILTDVADTSTVFSILKTLIEYSNRNNFTWFARCLDGGRKLGSQSLCRIMLASTDTSLLAIWNKQDNKKSQQKYLHLVNFPKKHC